MPNGYWNKILRVDLDDGRVWTEEPGEDFYRLYFGGRNFIAYYLLNEVPAHADPLGPDNLMIFACGPVTGTPVPGSARNSAGSKSPLTGAYGEAEAGGWFGAELKHAGYDAIIARGISPKPVYLWVHDGEAELRDASALWGKPTGETEDMMREELADKRVRTALIGPGGENLVRYAAIANDRVHFYGRCGLGAVMGSKKFKGVAVRGKLKLPVADPDVFRKVARDLREREDEWLGFQALGTTGGVVAMSGLGSLPTHNFATGSWDKAESISGQRMHELMADGNDTCYACPIRCKRRMKVEEGEGPWPVDPDYGGPEYESIGALGSCCEVDDPYAVVKAGEICNAYGLDTIGTGVSIAFAMECRERGLLSPEDMEGLEDLEFGNGEALVRAVEMIARREGFGDFLAEGTAHMAERIGQGSEAFAMVARGQEYPMHMPRVKYGLALGYTVSPTGAEHMNNVMDHLYVDEGGWSYRLRSLGIQEPVELRDWGMPKIRLFDVDNTWFSVDNTIGMCCHFVSFYEHATRVDLLRAATGWNSTAIELATVAERGLNMCRAFNLREGLTADKEQLPQRAFEPYTGDSDVPGLDSEALQNARETYFFMKGWDPETGVPSRIKLEQLDIPWVADILRDADYDV